MDRSKKYYKRLDIIRIISCVMVLLYHLNIIGGGFLAVCTFFTLSGYLECSSALKKYNFSIKDYYIKRLKKIYVPLIVVISITVIITRLLPNVNWLNLKPESISAFFGYNNFWQLKTNMNYFTKNVNSPFIHMWYISILMQFDLLFPLLYNFLKKIDRRVNYSVSIIVVFMLALSSTISLFVTSKTDSLMMVYYNTFARSSSILWGVFMALVHHKCGVKFSLILEKYNNIIFALYNLALCLLCLFVPNKTSNYALFMIIVTIISCRLIRYSVAQANFKNKTLNLLSSITYEVYLVQYPVIFFMQNINMSRNIKIILIIILTTIISYGLHLLINTSLKKKMYNDIKKVCILVIILLGCFIILVEKDNSVEIAKLKAKLNDNLKLMEEKNKNYESTILNEEKEWNAMMENMNIGEEEAVKNQLKELHVVGVGDSVFLNAVNLLYNEFPKGYFDGKVSRSIMGGIDVLTSLKNDGKLGNPVVLALATNTTYSDKKSKQLIDLLGDKEVYWINAVGASDKTFNDKFKNFAKDYSNIHIVDWQAAASGHPEYLYADGIHPKGNGVKVYVDKIYEAIYNDYLEKFRAKKKELIAKKEEERKNKIAFYGNNALINSFDLMQSKFSSALFNAKSDYDFDSLYNDISSKVQDKSLEYKVAFVFDNDITLTNEDYQKLIELCKGHEIYIVSINNKISVSGDNVKIIDFYEEIKKHQDYLMSDNLHLSNEGNASLTNMIYSLVVK